MRRRLTYASIAMPRPSTRARVTAVERRDEALVDGALDPRQRRLDALMQCVGGSSQ